MAVCEIWDVQGRLDHPLDYAENPEKTSNPKYTEADLQALGDVMKYATNGEKTERQFFVSGGKDRSDCISSVTITPTSGYWSVSMKIPTLSSSLSLPSRKWNARSIGSKGH